ncbi:MAG: transposase [Thermoplasmataceae archaeon]|jgi:transposase
MPYLVWKHSGKNRYLVMRWKKRVNGIPTVVKEVSIGSVENLASIIEGDLSRINLVSYGFGITASVLAMDREINLREIINTTLGHHDNGLSPGDYALIFIMNRLSDPRSKNRIHEWMQGDFASTLYPSVTAQGFWNMMDRFSDDDIKKIKDLMREKLISLGYDHSRLFVDGSNFYTFMEENDMAKRGHNKKHRYDLNEISYYIAANYDYIPFYGDSYSGNVPDVSTFPMMVENTPEDAIMIFDRGYNSKDNIDMIQERRYLGSLVQSDHRDLMAMPLERDSFMESSKSVYGRIHRIVVYHSSKLEKRHIMAFMKRFSRIYRKVRRIMESGDSDSQEKARLYLEGENLNETILLPSMRINSESMRERFSMMGKNALFTNIDDMKAEDLIDLYGKRNRVEHCFRTISMRDLASPLYHWTPQKIKVHMLFSYLAYMFLALIYNRIRTWISTVSLISALDILGQIRIVYAARGSRTVKRIDAKSPEGIVVAEKMKLLDQAEL